MLSFFLPKGPSGIAPIHDTLATALAHSVGANSVRLNLATVERVRDTALAAGIPRELVTKTSILTALLDACEDDFVDTTHPAIVIFNDHPAWLLKDDEASEVILEELKSVSSRVMFLAVSPEDTLQPGDYAPSARPPVIPVPPASADADGMGQDSGNPFASFASLFNGGDAAGGNKGSRTGK